MEIDSTLRHTLYSTNERAAYERVDIRQSVLAEALQEHLNEPRRVNDMLTSVGDDVATHGHQVSRLLYFNCRNNHQVCKRNSLLVQSCDVLPSGTFPREINILLLHKMLI